ncbi:hypothetical protein PRIPAC_80286 [Pristionchus pacificus]|uniref:Amidase n=1 Tax=Pristionchus pacificus TaxID=54126 RepID=A0A2A6CNU3_PRIPA|nr:hypothetical protein PRIPAC_80286 [Pristionchus pacificus]|eukprot:PDM79864.1 amidase [Pristionchus pacificus]
MDEWLESVARLASSKWTHFSIMGIVIVHLLTKMKERSMRNEIQQMNQARIAAALSDRDDSIEWARIEASKISDCDRNCIKKMDFRQLRDALQCGEVTAELVIRAHYGLALRAHERTNCLTGFIKNSLNDARKLDEQAKDPSYKKPHLFGIPLSVKECIAIEGERCTWGLAKYINHYSDEDSYQVMKLRSEGMIPFCQTNIPTDCLTINCSNSIYGTTTNPHASNRTSGGSSGGETALIVAGGSLCGWGSDSGGSIRVPAAFSGCCGFKPSATRLSTLQAPEPMPLRPILMTTEGPLARDPHAIVEIMRKMWSDIRLSDQDPFVVPVDFREDLFAEGRKYRIGYYTTDGYIDQLPGNQRVVREAVELLKAKGLTNVSPMGDKYVHVGHDLVPFSLGKIARKTFRGVFATLIADGGAALADRLKDEPLSDLMAPLRSFAALPLFAKKLLGWFCKMRGDTNTADFFLSQSTRAADVQRGIDQVFACRKSLVKKMKDEGIDVILCPATLTAAMPHALPLSLPSPSMVATSLWNAMDFPAGVVPVGVWTEEDETAMDSYEEKGAVETRIKAGCRNNVGLPLAVQIVAPAFRDEMVLRVMVDLHESMKKGANDL